MEVVHEASDRQAAQALCSLIRAARVRGEGLAERLARGEGLLRQRERSTFNDRPLEEPAGTGGDEVHEHCESTGRLARDGDDMRVAAEPVNIALHPTQGCLQVHLPV